MITRMGSGKEYILQGANLIKEGEVVAFPTETVYGLGANAFDESAVKKIFEAKGRPSDNPLILHLYDINSLEGVALDVPDIAIKLYEAFCPGPLTMILKKAKDIPYLVTGGLDTVGVRFPAHPIARELIKLAKCPIAAPSANLSKHISPTTARHVYEDLAGKIPLIIDGGASKVGIESTIVDLSGKDFSILRPGVITQAQLNAIGKFGYIENYDKAFAPGMKYTHYSPNCDCVVAENLESITKLYDESITRGNNTIILARNTTLSKLGNRKSWSLGNTARDAAQRFYSLLRKAEKKYSLIIIEDLGDCGICYSVMYRARKAAKII